jgi:hypothetical protein
MAKPALVSHANREHLYLRSVTSSPDPAGSSAPSRLESLRTRIYERGFSEEALDLIAASWRSSTEKASIAPGNSGIAGVREGIPACFQPL